MVDKDKNVSFTCKVEIEDHQVKLGRTIMDKSLLPFDIYIKKPVLVRAMQVNESFWVKTLEGIMKGKKGDYLIKGVEGELYPCKASIFKQTYEKV